MATLGNGHILSTKHIVEALEKLLMPSDRVALEGDNQKQADFLGQFAHYDHRHHLPYIQPSLAGLNDQLGVPQLEQSAQDALPR